MDERPMCHLAVDVLNLFEQAITAETCSVTHLKPAAVNETFAMLNAVTTRLRGLVLNISQRYTYV